MSRRTIALGLVSAVSLVLILAACAAPATPTPAPPPPTKAPAPAAQPTKPAAAPTQPAAQAAKPTPAPAKAAEPAKPAAAAPKTQAPAKAAAPLRKLALYLPLPVKTIAMFPMVIPADLGYYQEEGLDVAVETTDGSPFIMQQMATGKADAGLVIAGTAMSAWAQGHKSKAVWEMLTQPVFKMIVPEESQIKSFQDLKGKVVGVEGLQGGDIPELKAELAKAGLTEGRDYQIQPLGEEMAAVWQTLKGGKVAAFNISYNNGVRLEGTGAKFRAINPPVDPSKLKPSVPLVVRNEVIEKEPQVAIGLARAMSKAVLFAKENPNAALAIMKKAFPPEHSDANFTRIYMQRAIEMSWPARGIPFGQQSLAGGKELQQLMINPSAPSGLQKEFDLAPFISNDLIKEINNFDQEKVKKDAKDSKLTYP